MKQNKTTDGQNEKNCHTVHGGKDLWKSVKKFVVIKFCDVHFVILLSVVMCVLFGV